MTDKENDIDAQIEALDDLLNECVARLRAIDLALHPDRNLMSLEDLRAECESDKPECTDCESGYWLEVKEEEPLTNRIYLNKIFCCGHKEINKKVKQARALCLSKDCALFKQRLNGLAVPVRNYYSADWGKAKDEENNPTEGE